jgi:hypothetical protein
MRKDTGGSDGFFQVGAIDSQGQTLDQVCDSEAHHKLQPHSTQRISELKDVVNRMLSSFRFTEQSTRF